MMMNMLIIFMMYMIGNMIFVSKHKHLLIVLLSLEFIVLSIFFLMMIYLMMINNNNMYMLMVFMVFSVCEGALGLSILVLMIRTHGNDYFQSYNLI
uniref:NADH-ubiquinone oxidoreductase chain 4L n=1 Tax=Timelaea maculata TaxID=378393 RepID=R9R3T8_9NEOP|nr:NADH dehydrogenase subunit 4L [Timelaea maculata]AGI50315.1 NADH dehydrogenase subunit 4L [Timelaea maculata]USN89431.1 NADH dehydrogenase subunit 4L [Timelaea maculata]